MTGKRLSSVCLLLALCAASATGQPREQPAAGGGDASISGRVLTGSPPAPLAGVVVLTRAGRDEVWTSITDSDGRYSLTDLPDGRYTVTASRGGYVIADDDRAGVGTVEVGPGEARTSIDFHLARGAVVTGIVTDQNGQLAVGARVEAQRYRFGGGRWRMRSAGLGDYTDDRGMFRLYGLSPGEYYIQADTVRALAFLSAGGIIGSSSPTYYPNTTDLGSAQRLSLDIAEERAGIDITMAVGTTVRVSGQVVDSQGRPLARGSISLIGRNPPGLSTHAGAVEAGTFEVVGVPPGEYVLYTVTPALDGPIEFATLDVETTGEDLDQVLVRTTIGATARGRIFIEGGAAVPFRPQDLQLYTLPVGFVDVPVGRGVGQVNQDWSFEMRGMGEHQLIRMIGLPEGWALRAVLLDGQDITDRPVELPDDQAIEGLRIEVTNRTTRFRATLVDDTGQPAPGTRAVVFAVDPTRWQYPSRFVHAVRSDRDGIIDVPGLPAEQYLVFAAPGIALGAETEPRFLEQIRSHATAFTLGDGEMRELSITVGELP